jgi:hypothetical protein
LSGNQIQKRNSGTIKERGQYFLAFGVVASMLLVAGFPIFVIAFFGVFAFFLFKMFASSSSGGIREVFEFYLTANEMLRDDDRRWYGFELREAIDRGESLLQRMSGAPPLVHFALGALYNKVGDHKQAVRHLAIVSEGDAADERSFMYPTPELRNYVRVLRKIEREPGDAPLTSAAVRSLERARRIRGPILLEASRREYANGSPAGSGSAVLSAAAETEHGADVVSISGSEKSSGGASIIPFDTETAHSGRQRESDSSADPYSNRKSISEVLHDIYDSKRS